MTSRHPRILLTVIAGRRGATLRSVSLAPARGLGLRRLAFPGGVTARVAGHRLQRSALSLGHGVSFALSGRPRRLTATIAAPTLRVARSLRNSLRHHRSVRLVFVVRVKDASGRVWRLLVR